MQESNLLSSAYEADVESVSPCRVGGIIVAQAPPTFVSAKNNPDAPASHLHRQIELQSNAQTPFFEAYKTSGPGSENPVVFDHVVKDTFKRYNPGTGIYVFPVPGFWVVTAWMEGGAGVHFYREPNDFDLGVFGVSNTIMTTWQFYAGPQVITDVNAFSIATAVAGGGGGAYICQVDAVCVAQY